MSRTRRTYTADYKAKLVLEVLPVSLKKCKKQFLENMSLAFDKSAVVKEYSCISIFWEYFI